MSATQFSGMSELWQLAWALQGLNRTLDIEESGLDDTPFERDRLSGIATAAHLLSSRLLEFADAFNEVATAERETTLARIAADTGETAAEVAAGLLSIALDASIAEREAEQAAALAREERIAAARLKAKAAIITAVDQLAAEEQAA
ncbi:hypothetical protein [Thiocapsa sp. UBA6158]|jgi:hypothetical protein|uniref:hypothetical protein n=1 Tax=Thiocapsa sp. UBA6158 TaxID=1947692 RepID=UPI0025F05132|nr:hypothetical protein [Thiocapsa sp. UBA6158]